MKNTLCSKISKIIFGAILYSIFFSTSSSAGAWAASRTSVGLQIEAFRTPSPPSSCREAAELELGGVTPAGGRSAGEKRYAWSCEIRSG